MNDVACVTPILVVRYSDQNWSSNDYIPVHFVMRGGKNKTKKLSTVS